jgi:hypothetical protein
LIKAERQMRKLVTHLVYQFPCFDHNDISGLRSALGGNRHVYFEGFEWGFDALYSRTIRAIVGVRYESLRSRIAEAINFRNKIFHGQLTPHYLKRGDLLGLVKDVRGWCEVLAVGAEAELGYDGFGRNSFQKSTVEDVWKRFSIQITSVANYEDFIRQHMERR